MGILRKERGRRRGALAVLTTAGMLVAFQVIAVIGALPAFAASCTFSGGVITINSTTTESITVARDAVTGEITVTSTGAGSTCTGALTPAATLANTTAINFTGDVAEQDFIIDMTNGGFGSIVWTLASDGSLLEDFVIVANAAGSDVVVGATGVDLNNDGTLDVTHSGFETLTLVGAAGDDSLRADGSTATGAPFAGGVTIVGGAGDDTIAPGAGVSTLDGGASGVVVPIVNDTLSCEAATAAIVHLPANIAGDTCLGAAGTTWVGFENVIGSPGIDSLTGDGGANIFTPGAGADVVAGGGGADTLDLSLDATDSVSVDTAAGTTTSVDGNDTFSGSLFFVVGTSFASDELNFGAETGPVTANLGDVVVPAGSLCVGLAANVVTGATTVSGSSDFENALGSPAGDTIAGGGSDRNDLRGGDGEDTLCGEGGNDTVIGGLGNDNMDGGTGFDFTSFQDNTTSGVQADLAVGFASSAESGDDTLVNFENINGSNFRDNLRGNPSNNTIKGLGGNDNIRLGAGDDTGRGGAGNDAIRGGTGDDDLFGGRGNDALFGGGGVDLCRGGPGNDTRRGCELGGRR